MTFKLNCDQRNLLKTNYRVQHVTFISFKSYVLQ